MIEVDGLTKLYGDFAAVTGLSFTVQPGELLGLVGPNGAGKTTTLRSLAGIIPATRGTIRIAGHDLMAEPVAAKQQLAFFSDEPRLFDYLTIRQHLDFTARLYQVADAPARYAKLLEELELTSKADQLPGDLSRGMKQKVQIACGLLHSPRVVFFDEPLTGLDPLAIRRMKDTIRRLAAEGAAIVLSSHLLHLVEELCTRILVLKGGMKVAHGTVNEIRAQFAADDAGADLEEVFIRIATGTGSSTPPPPPPPIPPAPPLAGP
jgi:ABC-2 type transport system ATP-binding protein